MATPYLGEIRICTKPGALFAARDHVWRERQPDLPASESAGKHAYPRGERVRAGTGWRRSQPHSHYSGNSQSYAYGTGSIDDRLYSGGQRQHVGRVHTESLRCNAQYYAWAEGAIDGGREPATSEHAAIPGYELHHRSSGHLPIAQLKQEGLIHG